MLPAEHIVVGIVGGGDLQAACAEIHLNVFVFDDGNLAADQRNDDALPLEVGVLRIVGVDTHRRVAHDCLGARCRHNGVALFSDNMIAKIIKLRMFVAVNDLGVAQGRARLRVPVNHPDSFIYKPFAVEVDKDAHNRAVALRIHGESRALPVTRCAELLELLENDSAMLLFPCPGVF